MDAVIINFEKIKEQHIQEQLLQKELLITQCKNEIRESEDKIQNLYSQITELQSIINFNYRLLSQMDKHRTNN